MGILGEARDYNRGTALPQHLNVRIVVSGV